ncbi:hypothetical protein AAFF_G00294740 [Aldrovandia affinis]|uniref:Uncharacterized protein n=1 Tax=Aldrovandia affinis TaxID=143900 RepID=A0AAD7W1G6_9TELE|nr:hypothetical protein AAFF_G00294740 [Aldrovandia affinis]
MRHCEFTPAGPPVNGPLAPVNAGPAAGSQPPDTLLFTARCTPPTPSRGSLGSILEDPALPARLNIRRETAASVSFQS